MPIIATTIINSISVKPDCLLFIAILPNGVSVSCLIQSELCLSLLAEQKGPREGALLAPLTELCHGRQADGKYLLSTSVTAAVPPGMMFDGAAGGVAKPHTHVMLSSGLTYGVIVRTSPTIAAFASLPYWTMIAPSVIVRASTYLP